MRRAVKWRADDSKASPFRWKEISATCLRDRFFFLFFITAVGPVSHAPDPVISSPAPVIKDARSPPVLALQPEPSRHYPPSVIPSFPPVHSQPGASEGLWEISWHPPPL